MPRRLVIVTTHPIQYQAPWFRALAAHPEIDLQVYFCQNATPKEQAEGGFGVEFAWDTPILEGYPYQFLKNVAAEPSIHRFSGLDTPELPAILRRGKYNAVLVSGWNYKAAWQAIIGCWRARLPVMARGDSHLHTPRHLLKQMLKYPLYRGFISRFDACLAVGTWSREYYLHYGASNDRIFFVPHVTDATPFLKQVEQWQQPRSELRQGWQLAEDAVVFLFCGKLNEKKRPLDFIRAVADANAVNPHIAGIIVGDGALRAECEALIAQLEAPIQIIGFLNQSEIAKAYVVADMLVLPSDARETWGLVVNEAMLASRPCILSDQVGSTPDLIAIGETGDVYPMGDVPALAKLMTIYAQEPRELARMGEYARQRILNGFSIDQAVEGVLEALDKVTNH
jgi:glycosyltransferase involved in cell wall biosynthesis